MIIKINTKGKWNGDIFDKETALFATSNGGDKIKELERAMIEINRFLSARIDEINNFDN